MATVRRKRPKVSKLNRNYTTIEIQEQEATVEEQIEEVTLEEPVEEVAVEVVEEIVEEPATEEVEEIIEEPVTEEVEEIIEEPTAEDVEENTEIDEVPLENDDYENQEILDEEGSLDGTVEEVEELLAEEVEEIEEEPTAEEIIEEPIVEEVSEVVEETTEVVEEPTAEEIIEEPIVEEVVEVVEETTEVVEEPTVEEIIEEPIVEEVAEVVEETAEVVEEPTDEEVVEETEGDEETEAEEEPTEEVVTEKAKKEEFKLTPPANLDEILANICTKRARKLIYRPNEVIFSHTTTVLGTDKNNEEKIKVKNILDAEIKQGVKLGYLDKFDGLKMSELKEEYENDIVYEYADQEFKRTGLVLDGDKVKVYIYDWDMKACHHVGYIDEESVNLVKQYLIDREKYSFDINGIIVGGKYKKITKDEKTGKVTVEKGNDGNLGMEIDINIINRKD